MSRMLKALTRIDEDTAHRPDALAPLSSAELAELNAKSCHAAASTDTPAETSLDRAEEVLREATAETMLIDDIRKLAAQPVAEADPAGDAEDGLSWESTFQTISAGFDASEDWIVSAATESPPVWQVAMVESARLDAPGEPAAIFSTEAFPTSPDAEASCELRVSGDYSWRVESCELPAPAECSFLVEPLRTASPSCAAEAVGTWQPSQGISTALPIESARQMDLWTDAQEPACQPIIATVVQPNEAQPPVMAAKTRRQCERLAEQLIKDWADTQSALLLFAHVDDSTPVGPMLATLATLLAEQDSGRVLLSDARFHRQPAGDLFTYDRPAGLADYLYRGLDWGQLPIVAAGSSLDLLSGGHWPTDDDSLPTEDDLLTRCLELSSRYRFVLVDATGLSRAEARALLAAGNGVYLLADLGRGTVSATEAAAARIRTAGGHVAGCVLVYSPVTT